MISNKNYLGPETSMCLSATVPNNSESATEKESLLSNHNSSSNHSYKKGRNSLKSSNPSSDNKTDNVPDSYAKVDCDTADLSIQGETTPLSNSVICANVRNDQTPMEIKDNPSLSLESDKVPLSDEKKKYGYAETCIIKSTDNSSNGMEETSNCTNEYSGSNMSSFQS